MPGPHPPNHALKMTAQKKIALGAGRTSVRKQATIQAVIATDNADATYRTTTGGHRGQDHLVFMRFELEGLCFE
jgi:hypothetical protein